MQKENKSGMPHFFGSRFLFFPIRRINNSNNAGSMIIRILLGLCLSLFFMGATIVYAKNNYIRGGATGNNDGSDWNNAYNALPATLIRGDTYYIADGSYGNYVFDDTEFSNTYIYIKKATNSSHGTDVGWNTVYGDGTADFTYWTFLGNYYDIDGQVGRWADFLPNYVPYGMRVSRTTTGPGQHVIQIGGSGNPHNNLVFKHIEIKNGNTPRTGTWHESSHGVYGYGSYWTFQDCWIHDVGACSILAIGADFGLVENCALGRSGHAQVAMNFNPSQHSELVMLQPNADNWTFKNSYFYDWRSTGMLVLYDGNDSITFTGNVVFQTGYWSIPGEANDSDGIFSGLSGTNTNFKVVNNTFANINYGGQLTSLGASYSGFQLENNIFYKVKRYNPPTSLQLPGTSLRRYNWYYDCGSFTNETGQQNGSGNIFVNSAGYNFNLTSATNNGVPWGSPYNIDGNGITRGSGGNWGRGAFEFMGGGPPLLIPKSPSSIQIQ